MNVELVILYFDGACGPRNPCGHTSWGLVVKRGSRTLHEGSGYVGVGEGMSNNVAEYAGAIAALKWLLQNNISEAIIRGDSKMVVRQLSGRMKARKGAYLPFYEEARELKRKLPHVRFEHIRREKNAHADYLAGQVIRKQARTPRHDNGLRELIRQQRADMRDERLRFRI